MVSQFGGAMTRVSDAPLCGGNGISLLKNGPSTHENWPREIGAAEHWVHLENYIFHADGIGRRFADALAAGALGVSAVGVRHPRLLAWPLAAVTGFAGTLGPVQSARSAWTKRVVKSPPDEDYPADAPDSRAT